MFWKGFGNAIERKTEVKSKARVRLNDQNSISGFILNTLFSLAHAFDFTSVLRSVALPHHRQNKNCFLFEVSYYYFIPLN